MSFKTINVTGSPMTITTSDGIFKISVLASGGAITIMGNSQTVVLGGITYTPSPAPLADGQGVVIEGANTTPIDNCIIDPGSATAIVLIFN